MAGNGSTHNILIVEDEADSARLIEMLLRMKLGAATEIATDAAAARDRLASGRFDAVTLDYQLPDGDGLSLLEEIQAMESPPPVVLVTAHGDEDVAARSLELGASGYVVKDQRLSSLLVATVKRVLEIAQARLELRGSEERSREYLDLVGAIIVALDRRGNVMLMNGYGLRLLGYASEEEVIGVNWFDRHIPEEGRATIRDVFDDVMEGLEDVDYHENEVVTTSGERRLIGWHNTILRGPAGEITGTLSAGEDVTERRRIEQALHDREETYRELYEQSPVAYQALDAEGYLMTVNEAWLETLGYERDEVVGRWFVDLLTPESIEHFKQCFQEVKATGRAHSEFEMILRDGSHLIAAFDGRIGYDEHGDFKQTHCILQDITERTRAEEELRHANTELKGYAHTVSHDMKGPLSAAITAKDLVHELLTSGPTPTLEEQLEGALGILDSCLSRAYALADDLLMLAEAGNEPVRLEEVEVSEVVGLVLAERDSGIQEAGIEFEVDGDLGRIRAQHTHIYQVFANLVDNALNYGRGQPPRVRISRLESDEPGSHRYLVRDNGPGIPAEMIDDLFTPFTRGEYGGTGIGMAIVARIVGIYGGEVKAYNDPGACFDLTVRDYESP
ncbi:MAG: PAS domain S-box protein [Actinobacteria bacterium]|nr:PAS domain S-box protein [Actinomycetota bacterium]MBU1943375.1 PAS domain S-box protein [Actinomycetota bacterium]MBU2686732.1 PAS domain S-box protein [Actinomycetota bacterium]